MDVMHDDVQYHLTFNVEGFDINSKIEVLRTLVAKAKDEDYSKKKGK